VDKREQFLHLLRQALSKARKLQQFAGNAQSRAGVAELVAQAKKSRERIEALNRAVETNGKGLDRAALNSALDELIETFKDVNKKLDDLLAKAKG
jgi:NCAIR mutase (PurE)-related protein